MNQQVLYTKKFVYTLNVAFIPMNMKTCQSCAVVFWCLIKRSINNHSLLFHTHDRNMLEHICADLLHF